MSSKRTLLDVCRLSVVRSFPLDRRLSNRINQQIYPNSNVVQRIKNYFSNTRLSSSSIDTTGSPIRRRPTYSRANPTNTLRPFVLGTRRRRRRRRVDARVDVRMAFAFLFYSDKRYSQHFWKIFSTKLYVGTREATWNGTNTAWRRFRGIYGTDSDDGVFFFFVVVARAETL